jgi:serine/threonine-protein kinase RsbW
MKAKEPGLECLLASGASDIREVRLRVSAFALQQGFQLPRVEDITTAVEEACLNALQHGGPLTTEASAHVRLSYSDRTLTVEVQDGGGSLSTTGKKPDIAAKIAGTEPTRGWGVYLIESLADEVEFRSEPGRSLVRMKFVLPA